MGQPITLYCICKTEHH